MKFMRGVVASLSVLLMANAQATLIDRGGGLIYDTALDITWLQDASYANTSGYASATGGSMTWQQSQDWASNLTYHDSVRNIDYADWRLTDTLQPDTTCRYYCLASELSHLYYVDFQDVGFYSAAGNMQSGFGLIDDPRNPNDESLFKNMSWNYWMSNEYVPTRNMPYDNYALTFGMWGGVQDINSKDARFFAWAVRDGDVTTVPEPTTLALLGIALAGLGATRRKTHTGSKQS